MLQRVHLKITNGLILRAKSFPLISISHHLLRVVTILNILLYLVQFVSALHPLLSSLPMLLMLHLILHIILLLMLLPSSSLYSYLPSSPQIQLIINRTLCFLLMDNMLLEELMLLLILLLLMAKLIGSYSILPNHLNNMTNSPLINLPIVTIVLMKSLA